MDFPQAVDRRVHPNRYKRHPRSRPGKSERPPKRLLGVDPKQTGVARRGGGPRLWEDPGPTTPAWHHSDESQDGTRASGGGGWSDGFYGKGAEGGEKSTLSSEIFSNVQCCEKYLLPYRLLLFLLLLSHLDVSERQTLTSNLTWLNTKRGFQLVSFRNAAFYAHLPKSSASFSLVCFYPTSCCQTGSSEVTLLFWRRGSNVWQVILNQV